MRIGKRPAPPTGLRRAFFRFPILLYRVGLGALLGDRLLLLDHIGRSSGLHRQAVVEVAEHDPADGSYVVGSGFGPRSQWYRNVLAHPQVTIQVGRRRLPATAAPVPAEDGGRVMMRYAARHPGAARKLAALMGFTVDGTTDDYREVGSHIPFVRFTPLAGELDDTPTRSTVDDHRHG